MGEKKDEVVKIVGAQNMIDAPVILDVYSQVIHCLGWKCSREGGEIILQ